MLWRVRDELIRFDWEPPPSDPGAFQDSCRVFDLFDVRGRPACVVDPTLLRAGRAQHLKEFAVSIDAERGLLVVDLDDTSLRYSVCHYPDGDTRPASTPTAPPSAPPTSTR